MHTNEDSDRRTFYVLTTNFERNGSTRAWRKVREEVLKRDGDTCRAHAEGFCGEEPHGCTGRGEQVHHTVHRLVVGDDPEYLVASCWPCNRHMGMPDLSETPLASCLVPKCPIPTPAQLDTCWKHVTKAISLSERRGRPSTAPEPEGDDAECRECRETKPVAEFARDARRPCGHVGVCRPCYSARQLAGYYARKAGT